jgi:regulator of replication initiation timing
LSVSRTEDQLAGDERFRRLNAALAVLADELADARREAAVLRVENRELRDRIQRTCRA